MRVPYFRAKDLDSDVYVEGFYVEYPKVANVNNCEMVHAILVYIPDPEFVPIISVTSFEDEVYTPKRDIPNTLSFCTIDINTLQLIGEVEIGNKKFNSDTFVRPPQII